MDNLEKRSSSDLPSESCSTSSVYDAGYEKDNTANEAVVVVQRDAVEENEDAIEEEVHDEYDGDYQEYMSRYASYSNESDSIMKKFLKKKMLAILVLLVVCIVGIVVGLSVHFTQPPTTTVASTMTMSRTTTVIPIETASARGTLFSIK